MKTTKCIGLIFIVLLIFSGCYYDNKAETYGTSVCDTLNPTYAATIEPMIKRNCIGCHGSVGSGGVSLNSYELVKSEASSGRLEGVTNQLQSYYSMPPGTKMSNCELNQIAKWVRLGMPR